MSGDKVAEEESLATPLTTQNCQELTNTYLRKSFRVCSEVSLSPVINLKGVLDSPESLGVNRLCYFKAVLRSSKFRNYLKIRPSEKRS